MQRCIYCGADLPANARFCAQCGREQADTSKSDAAPTISSASFTPPGQTGSYAENAPTQVSGSRPLREPAREREKDDRTLLAPLPFPPAAVGQPPAPAVPAVSGAPQPIGAPMVTGSPPPPPGVLTSAATTTAKAGMSAAVKWAIIAVVAVVVVAGTGIGYAIYHFATLPQPAISATSQFHVGTELAGAIDTGFQVNGKKFSANSPISFFLDGNSLALNQEIKSDANGSFQAALKVTQLWPIGTHTLTARDGNNYKTQKGIQIKIVQQGVANTPGPNGAPPDDASFQVPLSYQYIANGQTFNGQDTLVVTGHPDPAGGSVCQPEADGKPHVYIEKTLNTSLGYRETSTFSCSGTYKGGKFTLTETMLTDKIEFTPYGSSATCTLTTAQVSEELSGSYTGNNTFSGIITYTGIPKSLYSCNQTGWYFFHYSGQGTWTGRITHQT